MLAVCKTCQQPFVYAHAGGRHRRYCSDLCRNRAANKPLHYVGETIEGICIDCQSTISYTFQGSLQTRCPDCIRLWHNKRHQSNNRKRIGPRKGDIVETHCKYCLSTFEYVKGHKPREVCNECKRLSWRVLKRARRGQTDPSWSIRDWHVTLDAFDHCCAYCGNHPDILTQDHFVPVKLGGLAVLGNIVPACRSCNCRKNATDPKVYLSDSDYERISLILAGLPV